MFHWSFTILLAAIVFCVLSFGILSPLLALVGKVLLAILIALSLVSLAVEFLVPVWWMQKEETHGEVPPPVRVESLTYASSRLMRK